MKITYGDLLRFSIGFIIGWLLVDFVRYYWGF